MQYICHLHSIIDSFLASFFHLFMYLVFFAFQASKSKNEAVTGLTNSVIDESAKMTPGLFQIRHHTQ